MARGNLAPTTMTDDLDGWMPDHSGLTLCRTFTDATDSNATMSDNPGPGSSVDGLVSRLKAPLERAITRMSARLGYGPAKPMRYFLESMRCAGCDAPFHGEHGLPTRNSLVSAGAIVGALFRLYETRCSFCTSGYFRASEGATRDLSKRLVKLLRQVPTLFLES